MPRSIGAGNLNAASLQLCGNLGTAYYLLKETEVSRSRRCLACSPMSDLGQLAPLPAVQAELTVIDSLSLEIQDLTDLLHARLSPELFRLVWALRDAVEKLGLGEAELRERHLVESLALHLPEQGDAIRMLRHHIFADDVPIDGAV